MARLRRQWPRCGGCGLQFRLRFWRGLSRGVGRDIASYVFTVVGSSRTGAAEPMITGSGVLAAATIRGPLGAAASLEDFLPRRTLARRVGGEGRNEILARG